MIRKKHMTLCFSLFLALSMVLGQLIPVAATDEVPAEVPVEETGIPEAEPVQPDPEPTEEVPLTEPDPTTAGGETPDDSQGEEPGDDGEQGDSVGPDSAIPSDKTAAANDFGASTLADTEYTVEVGKTITIKGSSSNYNHTWTSSNNGLATVSGDGSSATVTGVAAGTVTITHSYRYWGDKTETFTVTVKDSVPEGLTTVYVYIAAMDLQGNRYSEEMAKLLKIDYNKINGHNWFAAGTVQLDLSKLTDGNKQSTILNSDADWANIISQIQTNKINTSTVIEEKNKNNLINDYIDKVIRDKSKTDNGSKLLLADASEAATNKNNDGITYQDGSTYNAQGENQNNSGSYTWHLDLRFETVHINYYYGENGITAETSDKCIDGTKAAESKVFIKGAVMDDNPTITIPEGYKLIDYYSNYQCTEGNEWRGKNQPINEDTDVYVKVVPMTNVTINYVVAKGNGTVTDPSHSDRKAQNGMDSFNPVKGNPVGSKAEPENSDWLFDGWYSDEDCKNFVSKDANYVPSKPNDGWGEGAEFTYYAKFVPKTKTIKITNSVTGNAADTSKEFVYHLEIKNGDKAFKDDIKTTDGKIIKYDPGKQAHVFTLTHGQSMETQAFPQFYSYTVTQQEEDQDGNKHGYTTSLETNCSNPNGSELTNTHGHELNHASLSDPNMALVAFTNEKIMTVPTGLEDHNASIHGLMLSAGIVVLLFGAIIAIKRRMNAA